MGRKRGEENGERLLSDDGGRRACASTKNGLEQV
jgi:hypothetical protein